MGTAETILLRDSLFYYERDLGIGLHAYNFWTTEKIEPGATYRFSAAAPDRSPAEAIVPIPEDYSSVVVGIGPSGAMRDFVRVPEEVEHVAMVHVVHHIPEGCRIGFPAAAVFQRPSSGSGRSFPTTKLSNLSMRAAGQWTITTGSPAFHRLERRPLRRRSVPTMVRRADSADSRIT